jgi:integrase
MAWLQIDPSGNHHLSFRFGGRKYKRSLKTKDEAEAAGRLHRLEENIRLVESGRITIPEKADIPVFLLSDGKLNGKPKTAASIPLTNLFQRYFDGIPSDSIEESTIKGMKTHQRHLERHIGARFRVHGLTRDDLQKYVGKRSKEKGIRGRKLSPATIKKELVTFRSVWNWALAERLVLAPFPLKGVRFPKTDEKPRFQTWDEISRQCDSNVLTDADKTDLWDCLFLTKAETETLLDYVQSNAAHPFIYPMFVAAAHTGARRSELMRSQLIDLDGTHLTIREKKRVRGQRSTRRVPMSARLRESIDEWRRNHPGGPHTFCLDDIARSKKDRSDLEPLSRDEANDHFKRTLSTSKWKVIRGWHCFRHSFCSNCALQGVDQRIIDAWVGHTTDAMRRRYRHLFPSEECKVIEGVFG